MFTKANRKRTILIVIVIFALTIIVYPLLFSPEDGVVDPLVPATELPADGVNP